MSESAKAVFLSYASQDAAAVQRICDALRAAGVEVWFDQNELRGGDAWDQKIRRQIKECALFVPIISASTQARPEGYFRLEWKLAVDRSHLMSDDHPFLFPVVIDETPNDASARVPDRFRDVQWMRLDLRDTPETLAARVAGLLAGSGGGETAPATARPGPAKSERTWWMKAGVIVGAIFALVYGLQPLWVSLRRDKSRAVAAPTAPPSPTSKAQQLVAQARALFEPWDFASADDFKLAERLLQDATNLEPQNAEAWAAAALVSYALHVFGYDRSDARDVALRTAAERAIKLAADSDYARLALALRHRRVPGNDEEARKLLEELAARHPADKFILRQLGSAFLAMERYDEALTWYRRAAALPGGDPIALAVQVRPLQRMQRIDEAEQANEQALALRPDYGYAHLQRVVLLFYERGDLERMKAALRQIPVGLMSDERVAATAAILWYFGRDTERAAEALRYVPRDYIESNVATMSKGWLAGLLHRMAGRPEAAALEWRQALRVLERRLEANATASGELGDKAMLHALLGERPAAEEALRAFEQLRRTPSGRATTATWQIYAELDRAAELADFFGERLRGPPADTRRTYAAILRFHPALDRFREQPRFQELAREADRLFAEVASPPARK